MSVDATYRHNAVGIAAVLDGRDVRPLFADVLDPTTIVSNVDAEWIALEEAMRIAHKARWTGRVIFRTDVSGIADTVHRDERTMGFLAEHPEWSVVCVPRRQNAAAHTLAAQAVKIWLAGRAGEWTASAEEVHADAEAAKLLPPRVAMILT